ncbi:hypothetical protein TNCT_431111 [Trichonephila clavata]|uniref:Uncharacterized protein n=1 Tax=Trichonephila clavata TaxID=2740835 RepID=A0A8X6H7Z3_TRICU|nr:hypothetical protein TNCT_431111 [Trichonephila clavata]
MSELNEAKADFPLHNIGFIHLTTKIVKCKTTTQFAYEKNLEDNFIFQIRHNEENSGKLQDDLKMKRIDFWVSQNYYSRLQHYYEA